MHGSTAVDLADCMQLSAMKAIDGAATYAFAEVWRSCGALIAVTGNPGKPLGLRYCGAARAFEKQRLWK